MSISFDDDAVRAYACPNCEAYVAYEPVNLWAQNPGSNGLRGTSWSSSRCVACGCESLWQTLEYRFALRWPIADRAGPPPHPSTPEDVLALYNEARAVASVSPRAAAALLRLALETLTTALAPDEPDLNRAIGALVRNGLPVSIQKAMDTVRVIGNNAVHPSEIRLNERAEEVATLFMLLNAIVDNQIAQPAAIDAIYASLPDDKLAHIDSRDRRR